MRHQTLARRRPGPMALGLIGLSLAWSAGAGAQTDAETEARMAATEAEIEARGAEMAALAEEIEARTEEGRARDMEVEERLAEAQRQMEEAAREVAELSARLSGDAIEFAMRGFDTRRAMLGIHIGLPQDGSGGVMVNGVTPDGPADKAGLRSGDVITMVDGLDLTAGDPGDGLDRLEARMKDATAGEELAVTVRRGDALIDFTVVPEEMSPLIMAFGSDDGALQLRLEDLEELEALKDLEFHAGGPHGFAFRYGPAARWGDMELVSLTPDLGGYFGSDQGLLVVRAPTDPGLGLKDGDVILSIDGRVPADPAHAMRILRSYEPGERLGLEILRERARQQLEIVVPAAELGFAPPPPPRGPAGGPAPPQPPPHGFDS